MLTGENGAWATRPASAETAAANRDSWYRTSAACRVRRGALPEPSATGITSSNGRSPT